jgi:hypothetical protein
MNPSQSMNPGEPTDEAAPGGVDAVAVAVARLDELPHLEPAERPAVFQDIHTALQGALASIDDA